jgi:hypothetical protein
MMCRPERARIAYVQTSDAAESLALSSVQFSYPR